MAENNFVTAVETERKFVIEMPDLAAIEKIPGCTADPIVQDYLRSTPDLTHRVRSRERGGEVRYYETVKRKIAHGSSVESEREIDRTEYTRLLALRDPATVTIRKTRYSFGWCDRVIEIDVYPQWERSCIMEVELPDINARLDLPPFIRVIADVTGDKRYSNASMSRAFPRELI